MKKINFSTLRNFIIGVLLFVLGTVIGARYVTSGLPFGLQLPFLEQSQVVNSMVNLTGDPQPPAEKNVDFDVFWEVWSLLERDYLEPEKLETKKMVNGAVSGMMASIGDPYTMYLPPKDNKRSGENLAGKFYGVGIELGYIERTLAVISPLDGTPAEEAGLQAGDLILHVKDEKKGIDEDTTEWSLVEAVNKIRGEKGVEVTFTIYREGVEGTFDVAVKRGEIVVESVKLEFIEDQGKQAAHLKVSKFGDRTKQEWDGVVDEILAKREQIAGIVLDLRNNPGGYFDRSIELASDFIEKDVVVSQKGKYDKTDYRSQGEARLEDIPTVVLVNKGSASASEIVAGALRDDLGIKLIGKKTFGKGTVQDRRQVSNGGGVHITIGRWLLPNGGWIHDEGIPVDIEVEANAETEEDEVLLRGIEEL
ncbi:MAG: S41 family peptidase [Patescibacteria group bacterium]|nr:S41 family peptidase [Patescibacteria group bacterium]